MKSTIIQKMKKSVALTSLLFSGCMTQSDFRHLPYSKVQTSFEAFRDDFQFQQNNTYGKRRPQHTHHRFTRNF
jgi:hypothetical protein